MTMIPLIDQLKQGGLDGLHGEVERYLAVVEVVRADGHQPTGALEAPCPRRAWRLACDHVCSCALPRDPGES